MFSIITISGPSSTGKTTLLNILKEKLPNVHFYDEFIRIFIQENNIDLTNIENDPKQLFDFQIQLCIYTQDKFYEIMHRREISIIDRSSLDCIVYLLLNYANLNNQDKLRYCDLLHKYITKMNTINQFIDINYMTQVDINKSYLPENDNFRLTPYISQRALEIELFQLVALNSNIVLLPNNINERVNIIFKNVMSKIKN